MIDNITELETKISLLEGKESRTLAEENALMLAKYIKNNAEFRTLLDNGDDYEQKSDGIIFAHDISNLVYHKV